VHRIVRDALADLYQNRLGATARPLVVLAHSFGGHVMSNYIWDVQRDRAVVAPGANDFERLRTLKGIVTFGCPIPLLVLAHDRIVPIRLPEDATWLNFYDRDDVFGYPLRPVNEAYRETVTRDVPVSVGGLLTSWNPLSHGAYWTDEHFVAPVAELLSALL
jgi:hypothetical protein